MKFVALTVITLSFVTATSSPCWADPPGGGSGSQCTETDNGCTLNGGPGSTEHPVYTCCKTTECATVKTMNCSTVQGGQISKPGKGGAPARAAPITPKGEQKTH